MLQRVTKLAPTYYFHSIPLSPTTRTFYTTFTHQQPQLYTSHTTNSKKAEFSGRSNRSALLDTRPVFSRNGKLSLCSKRKDYRLIGSFSYSAQCLTPRVLPTAPPKGRTKHSGCFTGIKLLLNKHVYIQVKLSILIACSKSIRIKYKSCRICTLDHLTA